MVQVIFKVFASAGAQKPLMERVIYPVSGQYFDYTSIIESLHQLYGETSVVIISHENVKK